MNRERSGMVFQVYYHRSTSSLDLLLVSHGTRSQIHLFDGCARHDVEVEDVNW